MTTFRKCLTQSVALSLNHYMKGETKKVKDLDSQATSSRTFLSSNSKSLSLGYFISLNHSSISYKSKIRSSIVVIGTQLKMNAQYQDHLNFISYRVAWSHVQRQWGQVFS